VGRSLLLVIEEDSIVRLLCGKAVVGDPDSTRTVSGRRA
jgi:hypothetical protein